ncbi:bi-domain-containing oxidoreductase [Kiloniella majae]|uniref:bi-domain-containing oxidoreductase n=1 Tax=Kiloniella majae TaxID=1938558 RepID=UPI000A277765|nr:bi-domain-containing oxidoreductase [Kiloniella majae]
MKQVLIRHGGVSVETVPDPSVSEGSVLVRVEHSCISVGTEMSGVKTSNMPLWKRALKQPENVKKVYERVRTHGLKDTRRLVQQKLDTSFPIGYSVSGTVTRVGEKVTEYAIGDRVTCAGSQAAFHAEIVNVPQNLVCPIPTGLSMKAASTVTLGAIALQGVRRATPTIGETFVVIGLGILGQLTHQILRANGINTIGTDIDEDRIRTALALGLNAGVSTAPDLDNEIARLTNGVGADGVIITAATSSDALLSQAFKACRRKGRVVLVGDVGLNIDRSDIYAKELDFLISTSYGPGRYDKIYEEDGLDYPLPYVRWSENRNMRAYLDLLNQGRVNVESLIHASYSIDEAKEAYKALQCDKDRPLSILLEYSSVETSQCSMVLNNTYKKANSDTISLSVIGAGGFASGTLLPIISEQKEYFNIQSIVTKNGHNAMNIARQFNAQQATTDSEAVCQEPGSNLLLIATRHHLHGDYVLKGLKAGKHVFVEKPTCLTQDQLTQIEELITDKGANSPILLTGFNRRFSKYAYAITKATEKRTAPMIINCRINAGHIPLDHWVHRAEGGGRNLGEACHFYDLFTYWTQSKVCSVHASAISKPTGYYGKSDNFVATISFEDGSVATLTYTALGNHNHPKERVDVYCDGEVHSIENYTSFQSTRRDIKGFTTPAPEKGHREELTELARAIKHGGKWPIPFWQQAQAMHIAFVVENQISS